MTAIPKATRDAVLVEARHRCTICSEKCYELHHIVEQSEGGGHDADNLIVLCPNCHQQRYHRNREFTRDQLRLYKAKLKEQNEVERRLLLNLEEIRAEIGKIPTNEVEVHLRAELAEAAQQVSREKSPNITSGINATSQWLGERELLRGGARRAIEIEWEISRERAKSEYPPIHIVAVDDDGWSQSNEFPAAYNFVLLLNQEPNPHWKTAFEHEYRSAFYNMKRRTHIQGDRIQMVVADSDNLQGHVDFAKELVKRTNDTITQRLFPVIDQKVDEGKREALRQFDAIKSLRQRTRDLRI